MLVALAWWYRRQRSIFLSLHAAHCLHSGKSNRFSLNVPHFHQMVCLPAFRYVIFRICSPAQHSTIVIMNHCICICIWMQRVHYDNGRNVINLTDCVASQMTMDDLSIVRAPIAQTLFKIQADDARVTVANRATSISPSKFKCRWGNI